MQINRYLDSTLLSPVATEEEINCLCKDAIKYNFASVCIHPYYVKKVRSLLGNSSVKVCTVVGFPLGSTTTLSKLNETMEAIAHGASEIDMVANLPAFKNKEYFRVQDDISQIVNHAAPAAVKVIVESSYWSEDELSNICQLALQAGAAFVKTSTGFSSRGASIRDITVMGQSVGGAIGIKASGGIKSFTQAMAMIDAGATRIGTSSAVSIAKEGENAIKR